MKFDKTALAGMLAVSAAVLAGCDERVCVDKQGRRVPAQYCGGQSGGGMSGAGIGAYYLVSGWRGGGVGTVGSFSGVARGGFGGEAAGHGGGVGGE
jgi:hypothetical protein